MGFGLAFWILFFAIFYACGKMCGWGRRRYSERRQLAEETGESEAMLSAGAGAFDRRARVRPEPARLKRTRDPVKALQQDFVEGRISMDEYERRLDSLERL